MKTYSDITNEARKKLGVNSSINLLILNKFDRLYDAMYLVPLLNGNKYELIKDKTSLAAIMGIDDFHLKSFLISSYNKDLKFDYVNFKKMIDEAIERTKESLLTCIEGFFNKEKLNEVYQIAVEYFEFLNVEDKQIIKNLRREMKKWNKLDNIDKLNFIEKFGNNLILLNELDKREGK